MNIEVMRSSVAAALEDIDSLRNRLVGLLADLDQSVDSIQVPRQGRWTQEMVATLWERVHHLNGVRALFELTAANPNTAITFTDLIARSGLSEQQQRNEHARMSRVAADLFGEKYWPIEAWQGSAPQLGGRAEMLYRMGGTVAAWWIELTR